MIRFSPSGSRRASLRLLLLLAVSNTAMATGAAGTGIMDLTVLAAGVLLILAVLSVRSVVGPGLLIGAIVSSTDAAAIFGLFRSGSPAPRRRRGCRRLDRKSRWTAACGIVRARLCTILQVSEVLNFVHTRPPRLTTA